MNLGQLVGHLLYGEARELPSLAVSLPDGDRRTVQRMAPDRPEISDVPPKPDGRPRVCELIRHVLRQLAPNQTMRTPEIAERTGLTALQVQSNIVYMRDVERTGTRIPNGFNYRLKGFVDSRLIAIGAVIGFLLILAIGAQAYLAKVRSDGYAQGYREAVAKHLEEKIAAIGAAERREAELVAELARARAVAEATDRAALEHETQWKGKLREARRQRLASCGPVQGSGVVGGEPGGSGITPARDPDAGATGIRLLWRGVGLHDGAYTGLDGQPLFRAESAYALAPERAETPSRYDLNDLIEVAAENARGFSACLRAFEEAVGIVDAAEKNWRGAQQP